MRKREDEGGRRKRRNEGKWEGQMEDKEREGRIREKEERNKRAGGGVKRGIRKGVEVKCYVYRSIRWVGEWKK